MAEREPEARGVAVITGASRGIGAACALRLALDGYTVCVNFAHDEARAEAVVQAIARAGGVACAVRADIANEAEVEALFSTVDQRLGRVTALVNNAGIVAPAAPLLDFTEARIARILAVNVTGTLLASREATRRMSKLLGGPGGAIVNVSSAASRLGSPGEYVDYAASKGAVDTLTVGLAKELAPAGIRVNAVRPGLIATELHAMSGDPARAERLAPSVPMQRVGTAREVADSVAWLLSSEAAYVCGAILDVAGGR
jgi:NAD(P)-dependent dehydrogenase (short-subunit alcohol dehydrogenase family)